MVIMFVSFGFDVVEWVDAVHGEVGGKTAKIAFTTSPG